MSYNGVGLSTARGSGTNGYVQKNASHIKQKPIHRTAVNYLQAPEHQQRAANKDILEHEKKRKVEIQVLLIEDELVEQGMGEEEIEEILNKKRTELLKKMEESDQEYKKIKEHQTHQLAEAKERDNQRFGAALGIKRDYVSGSAFEDKKKDNNTPEAVSKARKEADGFLDNLNQQDVTVSKSVSKTHMHGQNSPAVGTTMVSNDDADSERGRSPVNKKLKAAHHARSISVESRYRIRSDDSPPSRNRSPLRARSRSRVDADPSSRKSTARSRESSISPRKQRTSRSPHRGREYSGSPSRHRMSRSSLKHRDYSISPPRQHNMRSPRNVRLNSHHQQRASRSPRRTREYSRSRSRERHAPMDSPSPRRYKPRYQKSLSPPPRRDERIPRHNARERSPRSRKASRSPSIRRVPRPASPTRKVSLSPIDQAVESKPRLRSVSPPLKSRLRSLSPPIRSRLRSQSPPLKRKHSPASSYYSSE